MSYPTPPADRTVHEFANGVRVFRAHQDRVPTDDAAQAAERWLVTLLRETEGTRALYVDASAGVGYWVFVARQVLPNVQVISFETDAKLRDAFRDHVVLNGLFKTGIILREETLAAEETHSAAYYHEMHPDPPAWRRWLSALTPRPATPHKPAGPRAMTLDAMVERSGLDIDVLRADLPGADARVLVGAQHALSTHRIHRLVLRVADPKVHKNCCQALVAAGYTIREDAQPLVVATAP